MYTFLLAILILITPAPIHAQALFPTEPLPTQTLDSKNILKGDEYQLELKPLESSNATDEATLTDTLSDKDRTTFNNRGYLVKPFVFMDGSQNRESYEGGIVLSLSNARADFGTISGAVKKKADITVHLSAAAAYGYDLLVREAEPFQSASKHTIAPTLCNGKTDSCTVDRAKPWTSDSAYGFGYSLSGDHIPSDFKSADYFRPFKPLVPTLISKNTFVQGLQTIYLHLKAHTAPPTPEGNYATTIELLVLPRL